MHSKAIEGTIFGSGIYSDDGEHLYPLAYEMDTDSGEFRIELPLDSSPGWYQAATFVVESDRYVLAEIRVFPGVDRGFPIKKQRAADEHMQGSQVGKWDRSLAQQLLVGGGITSRLLRTVSPLRLLTELQNQLKGLDQQFGGLFLPRGWEQVIRAAPRRPGRAGRDDLFYAVWAGRYVQHLDDPTPIATLARRHRKKTSYVRDVIHRARERGLLTPGNQGRPGGALTKKAKDLLTGKEESLGKH